MYAVTLFWRTGGSSRFSTRSDLHMIRKKIKERSDNFILIADKDNMDHHINLDYLMTMQVDAIGDISKKGI